MTPEGVSEHVFALTLALLKNLVPIQVDMADGNWNMFGWRERGRSLHGRTLGIVGLGRIGKRVAALGHAFGCKLIYNDLVPAPEPLAAELDLERCELDEVLARADILTVHVPLTNLTRRLFQRASFDQMKPDAIFINTSRGGTYVMDDLHAALLAGRPGAAGLDVFLPEPPLPDHPLLSLPNVIVSPHIASGTIERQYAVNRAQFENCQQVLAGLPIHNQVQL